MYMADTLTVRYTMNVTFHEVDGVSPQDMPDTLTIEFRSPLPPRTEANSSGGENSDSTAINDTGSDTPAHDVSQMPIYLKKCKHPINNVFVLGPKLDSHCRSLYIRKRVQEVAGTTVMQALTHTYVTKVKNWNKQVRYTNQDLNWDLKHKFLTLAVPTHRVNKTFASKIDDTSFDTTPLKPVSTHVPGVAREAVLPE